MFSLIPKRRFPFLAADIILIVLAVLAAFLVRFELLVPERYFVNMVGIIALSLIAVIPVFYFSRLYLFTWEFVSTEELVSLAKATALSFTIVTAAFIVLRDHPVFSGFPRSTLFISYFFIFVFTGGLRFSKRIFRYFTNGKRPGKKERTLIVGAGGAGEQILRNILNSKNSPYLPVGFVDDSSGKAGFVIHGLKVLGKINDIPKITKDCAIDSLIIAFPSAGSEVIKRAQEKALEAGIMDVKYMPPLDELINSADEIGVGELRDIDMEELLGRKASQIEEKPIEKFISGKSVMITGAAGSIGSELSRQVAKFKPSALFLLDQDETGIFNISQELEKSFPETSCVPIVADICNYVKIEQLMKKMAPEVLFHAAAYKHVPLMENDPTEAVKNNILGTNNLVLAFRNIGNKDRLGKFIFISTDKAVNPTSVMGVTKRVGELICQAGNNNSNAKFISVRFGNVLGSRGSVIPIFKDQISRGGPVKITHKDMNRFFMVTSEACRLVLQAGAMGQGGEVFVLDMGNPVKIIDLAKELIRCSGFDADQIKIEYSQPRPGEKIFEELLTAEEGTQTTKYKDIFVAKVPAVGVVAVDAEICKLKQLVENMDGKSIIEKLTKLVPSYKASLHVLEKVKINN